MKLAAIISEYNPFHNGHKYHIERTRADFGATHVVAVMSGNFTQRGDVAVFDKFTRAGMALNNGVDLVLELPVAVSLGSAEQFAAGAVTILNNLNCNCETILSFGSESGDIELLQETAGAVMFAAETDEFFSMMRRGLTFPAALTKTIEKYYEDEITETLSSPNNTLAVEYLKALASSGSSVKPVTIKRVGAAHDGEITTGGIASASHLRKLIAAGESVLPFVPSDIPPGLKSYAALSRLETAILYKLRCMSAEEISKVPGVLHGLENRIKKAAKAARSLGELMALIKTKRYTLARLRRIVLCCLLGITKSDAKIPPQYIRILGMNKKGTEILANTAPKENIPLDASLAALMKYSENCKKQAVLESHCSNIYALAYEKPLPCGLDITAKPIILS